MLYINSTKTLCRLQKLILTVPILLFHMLFKEKNAFCFDQTGCTKKLDFDLFKCYKRLEHEKQMKNDLIVWFCLRVMVHKMSKMIHFLNVYAEINKKYTHFMVIRLVNLKDLITLFQKMVQIMGFSATAQEIWSPTAEVISCIFVGSFFS